MTGNYPERTVEVSIAGANLGKLTLSGQEETVSGAVEGLLNNVSGVSYVVEESAHSADGFPPEVAAGEITVPQIMNQVPGVWLPLNEAVLSLIRPRLKTYAIQTIAAHLALAGIRNCGDVLDRGLLGMSRLRMFQSEYAVVFGLVRAVTGRDIPMGYDKTATTKD